MKRSKLCNLASSFWWSNLVFLAHLLLLPDRYWVSASCVYQNLYSKPGMAGVLVTFKQAVHSPERQAGDHVLVDNDTGAVLLRCMA